MGCTKYPLDESYVHNLAYGQLLSLGHQLLLELWPGRLGRIDARSGTALLALKLKGAADSVHDGIVYIGRRMNDVEVLATRLTDDARV